ncbi:MAG: Fic family protein [Actinobacteria bacterium]|nr:Fic family protein [Actinomycetota bacterium]
MFEPKFSYTNEIVRNLTLIAEARAIILNVPLIPKWEVSLRREALIKSAHYSTSIEGNPLSFEDVIALAEGKDIMVRRKDKQEVLNYIEALEKVPEFAKKIPLIDKDLLEIHKIVSKETLENPKDEGVFRNRQVAVGNKFTGEIVFMPPPTESVPRLVNEFLEWFNSEEANKVDPVIGAGITHYEIARIHPFIDGNGRMARVMASLVLYKRGFDIKRFFALDDYYDRDRRSYYEALKSVDQETLDLTAWLEYFTNGVAVSTKEVRDKVIGLSRDIKFLKNRGQVALTKRQMKIVEKLIQNDRIAIGDIASEFEISRQAALKEMNKLLDLGVVRLEGAGRGAHYVLA